MFILRGLWSLFVAAVVLVGVIVGTLVAAKLIPRFFDAGEATEGPRILYFHIGVVIVCGLLGFLFALVSFRKVVTWANRLERVSLLDKAAVLVGIIIGLVVAILITVPFANIEGFGLPIRIFASVAGIVLGIGFAVSAKHQIAYIFPGLANSSDAAILQLAAPSTPKMLDTNIVIDGRIADIVDSGFLEGPLYVPDFILQELRHIADSSDNLKRARGRRGLDVLNQLKNHPKCPVRLFDDYTDEEAPYDEVDTRLVKLAQAKDAAIITNDYSVNEIGKLHGVPVLNVNELAEALKPVYLPGEEITVTVVKEGKQPGQGVAYLDDGTMVVVEEAADYVDRMIPAEVTSILQNPSGKMIFAKITEKGRALLAGESQQQSRKRR